MDKKELLKLRKNIQCKCKKQKSREKDRVKYGTNRCDAFSMDNTLGRVLSNSLYQYIADAQEEIIREDWDIIKQHADAIRAYAEMDSWDLISEDKKIKVPAKKIEKDWKLAMKWLTNNWKTLWW